MTLKELIQRLQEIEAEHGGEIRCYLVDGDNMGDEVKAASAWKRFESSSCVIIE